MKLCEGKGDAMLGIGGLCFGRLRQELPGSMVLPVVEQSITALGGSHPARRGTLDLLDNLECLRHFPLRQ
ncbi:MAG: hypothetical protein ACLQVL_27125 [Terriglobia bacterium]